jgi:hypothetical protein
MVERPPDPQFPRIRLESADDSYAVRYVDATAKLRT